MCVEGLPVKAWNESWELSYLSLPSHVDVECGCVAQSGSFVILVLCTEKLEQGALALYFLQKLPSVLFYFKSV